MRGPTWGPNSKRNGVPCPDPIVELQIAERTNWRIMPTGLEPGGYDDQSAVDMMRWQRIMSLDAIAREDYEHWAHEKRAKKIKRK